MSFSVVSSGTASTNTTSASVTGLTGQNGDLVVAFAASRGNETISPPDSSWTLRASAHESTIITGNVYTKVLSGSPASSYSFSFPGAHGALVEMMIVRGADATVPLDVAAQIATSGSDSSGPIIGTAVVSPAVTTITANTLIVTCHTISNATTFTAPSGMTEQVDFNKVAGTTNALAAEIATVDQAATGTSGTKTSNTVGPGRWVAATLALRPADTGGGTGGGGGNTLRRLGFGGGPNGAPITGTTVSSAYRDDYFQAIHDILGDDAWVRLDAVALQKTDGSGGYTWGTQKTEFLDCCDRAAALNLNVLASCHYQAAQSTQVPRIFGWNGSQTIVGTSEEMTGFKQFMSEVAATVGPGGTHTLTKPVVAYEIWNEPNQIGSCWNGYSSSQGAGRLGDDPGGGDGGFIIPGGSYAKAGYRKAVWLINRDGGDALLETATSGGWADQLIRIGLVTGGVDLAYTTEIVSFGESVGDNLYDHVDDTAHHLYSSVSARSASAGAHTFNGVGALRTYVNAHGGGQSEFWLTEGFYSGSSRWNKYQTRYNGQNGVGKANDSVVWMGTADVVAATHALHDQSQIDQESEFADGIAYIKEQNDDATNPWGVAAMFPHVVFDEKVSGTQNDGGYSYWQNCRGFAWRIPGDPDLSTYTAASGTPLTSPNWKPVAAQYQAAFASLGSAGPPPAPIITSGPSSTTTATGGTFVFTDARGSVTFQHNLDAGGWTAATSPDVVSGLATGSHQYKLRAYDSGGTSSVTTYSWTINPAGSPPPDPTFTSQPSDGPDVTATLAFTDADGTATFKGRLDGAAFAVVTSPVNLTGLSVGAHQYDIVAVEGSLQSGVVSSAWVTTNPATPPPEPSFISTPNSSDTATTATFAYTDDQAGVTYEYRLDSGSWIATTATTTTLTGLNVGDHTFDVRAVDDDGPSTAASYSWSVLSPVVPITPPPVDPFKWVIRARSGQIITGDLKAWDRSFTYSVCGDPECTLTTSLDDPNAARIVAGVRLAVWRNNDLVFHGEAWTLTASAAPPEDDSTPAATLTVTFKSLERLHHVTADAEGKLILQGDKYAKLAGVLGDTNIVSVPPYGNISYTGITIGDKHGSGSGSTRSWDPGTTTGQIMEDMFPPGGDGEYVFRPTTGSLQRVDYPTGAQQVEKMGELDVYFPRAGGTSSVVFRYAPGGGNLASVEWVRDLHQHVNLGIAQQETLGTKPQLRVGYRSLRQAFQHWGVLARVEQAGSRQNLSLAAENLLHSGPGEAFTITPNPTSDSAPRYWDDFTVGDVTRLVIQVGAIKAVRDLRIYTATITITNEGVAQLGDLTLGDDPLADA